MADNTLWVGVLTAGTAVVASWVTGRGTARAARIQAQMAAISQQADHTRAARRAAYVDVIEQAQRMGDLYWKITDAQDDPDEGNRLSVLKELRLRLRDEYAVLRNRVWVVDLEGPQDVAAAADRLRRATSENYRALGAIQGRSRRRSAFQRVLRPLLASCAGVRAYRSGRGAGSLANRRSWSMLCARTGKFTDHRQLGRGVKSRSVRHLAGRGDASRVKFARDLGHSMVMP
jgi:hypothetical protein